MIEQECVRNQPEVSDRPKHCTTVGRGDTDAVDHMVRGVPDSERATVRPNNGCQFLALPRRQSLRIPHAGQRARDGITFQGQHHGRGDDGTGPASPSHLINTRDKEVRLAQQRVFVLERRNVHPPIVTGL